MKRKVLLICALLVSVITLSGAANVITFTTLRKSGESVKLKMTYTGSLSLDGLTGTPKSGEWSTYTLTSQTVTIRGDVTGFYCSYNQLKALDVSQNTALTRLYCGSNALTALDVSKNTALTHLYCDWNPLTTLDVSQNTALTELTCHNNPLTALDVSKNTALTELFCDYNQLTTLDVSQNTALTRLDCYNNQLAALDVSKNTKLKILRCFGNQIKGEEMTHLVNSLPDLTGKEVGEFSVVQEPAPEGNICLKSDVAIAKGKN